MSRATTMESHSPIDAAHARGGLFPLYGSGPLPFRDAASREKEKEEEDLSRQNGLICPEYVSGTFLPVRN